MAAAELLPLSRVRKPPDGIISEQNVYQYVLVNATQPECLQKKTNLTQTKRSPNV